MKKFKENFKRFWSLQKHSTGGFTLVELIVVIAILAILAGIAVPAYSGYVEKANKQADQTLFGEIENAMHLAYYADPDFKEGYVMVTSAGATASNTSIERAMKASFGESWATTVTLKWNEWLSPTYQESSFYGTEDALLTKVDSLTDDLKDAIVANQSLIGDQFSAYLTSLNVENSVENAAAVADAAVLYVAQNSAGMTEEQRNAAIAAMSGIMNSDTGEALTALNTAFNGNTVAASAALYAVAQGYCQYEYDKGNTNLIGILDGQEITVDDPNKALEAVFGAFGAVAEEVVENEEKYNLNDYFTGGQVQKDAGAYLDIMNTISGAESEILNTGTLGHDNFFSNATISGMFVDIANGGAMVTANEKYGQLIVKYPVEK